VETEQKGQLKKKSTMNSLNSGGEISVRVEENEIQTSEEPTDEVEADGKYLSKEACDFIKQNKSESTWRERGLGRHTLQQRSPTGNTVVHIAALHGNDECVKWAFGIVPELLHEKNGDDDSPLHVAARAGNISTLEILLDALLLNLDPNSEEAKEAILVTNNQGNTFFHEALLNGHSHVMNILDSLQGFKGLVEETAFATTNNKGKSVLHLALLSRGIPPIKGTKLLHTFNCL